jgi:hypothetical protein
MILIPDRLFSCVFYYFTLWTGLQWRILRALGTGCISPAWLIVFLELPSCCSFRFLHIASSLLSLWACTFPMRKEKVFFPTIAQKETVKLPCFSAGWWLLLPYANPVPRYSPWKVSLCVSLVSTLPGGFKALSQITLEVNAQPPNNWDWLYLSPRKLQGHSLVSVLSFLVPAYFNFSSCGFSYSLRLLALLLSSSKFCSQPK